jgi:HTH-type transcriptional regulator, sugar sensing transcriptional regulator
MELTEALKNIGLNEKQAKVYVALLQTGKASAYQVAKTSNLKKPTTYVILDELIEKGMAMKVPHAKVMLYAASNPEDVFNSAKTKLENTEKEILPELKALTRGKQHKVKASYYEGMSGVKEAYDKLLKEAVGKEYVGFYAHTKDAPRELLEYFDEYNEKHRRLKLKRRGITVDHPEIRKKYLTPEFQKKYNAKLKVLPIEMYNSNISIEAFRNSTFIFSHRYLQGIILENPDVANVIRQIFEIVWKQGEKRYN